MAIDTWNSAGYDPPRRPLDGEIGMELLQAEQRQSRDRTRRDDEDDGWMDDDDREDDD